MPEDIVIRLESDSVDDDSTQINIMNILSEKIGALEANMAHMQKGLEGLLKVDTAIIAEVKRIEDTVETVQEEIQHVEEMGQAMAEEIKAETEEVKEATEEMEPDMPTADEEIAAEQGTQAPEPEPEPASDSAPGKEHWFFRKRSR